MGTYSDFLHFGGVYSFNNQLCNSVPGFNCALSATWRKIPGNSPTLEILVREVEQEYEDDASVISINDTSTSINHELGSFDALDDVQNQ